MTTFQALGHLHELRAELAGELKHHKEALAEREKGSETAKFHTEAALRKTRQIEAIDKVGGLLSKR
ncbi:MAG: hypothetical protein M5U26_08250 [Planctomycetota bacterium]|nr:hypothetical protein [Planctomycetota bacterium]